MFRWCLLAVGTFCSAQLSAGGDIDHHRSDYSVTITIDRLEAAVKAKGMRVFARIDHAAAARQVGKELRSTELLIFGNPAVGTLLMQSTQLAGLDLPLKALAWQDAEGQVWLAINTPEYLVNRHRISDRQDTVRKMTAALHKFVQQATTNGD